MNTSEKFLIDTNSFITPYLNYYPFDFASPFWEQLGRHITEGSIDILDMVKNEIVKGKKGKDQLSDWLRSIKIKNLVSHKDPDIVAKYSEVLMHIQNSEFYSVKALREWSQNDVADPWLIAAAHVHNYKIITFEQPIPGLNSRNPCGRPKIPDIARAFDVKCENLFYMMRKLSIML